MTHVSSTTRLVRIALCVAVLALGAVVGPLGTQHALARSVADVTTSQVSYHVHVTFVAGPLAGHNMDAGVGGTLDSTGALTATLMATTGATATVTGMLGGATQLTVAGKAANGMLSGKSLGAGLYGGFIMDTASHPVASWTMTLEPSTPTFTFAGVIRSGKHKGTVVSGTLALFVIRSGLFDGMLTLDDGSIVPVAGQLTYGNIMITFYMPHGVMLTGIAPKASINTTGIPQTAYTGTFIGPGTGDHGTWSASQN